MTISKSTTAKTVLIAATMALSCNAANASSSNTGSNTTVAPPPGVPIPFPNVPIHSGKAKASSGNSALTTQITTPDCRSANSCTPTRNTRVSDTRTRTGSVSIFERLFGWLPEWLVPQITTPNI